MALRPVASLSLGSLLEMQIPPPVLLDHSVNLEMVGVGLNTLQVILMEGAGWLLLYAAPPTGIVPSVLAFKRGPDFGKLVGDHNCHLVCKV